MTEWFEREKGDTAPLNKVTRDGDVLIVSLYDDIPDWVKTPPELGEIKLKVLGAFKRECPKCQEREVQHLDLASNYGVAKCHDNCGFVWYSLGGGN